VKFAIVLLAFASTTFAESMASRRAAWNQPFEPFHIVGNVYYVGTGGLSSFLIKTGDGLILIDGGLTESAPLIEKHIAELGFRIRSVKTLLNSHAHYDHAGGLAQLQRASGARVVASEGDAPVLRKDYRVKVDRTVHDGDTVQLGGTTLTAVMTPGHTRGCTTWTMPITDGGKVLRVVFFCSTSVVDKLVNNRAYPEIVSDYEKSFVKLSKLACDVFLGPHPEFFHLVEKRAKMKAGGPNPFIDSSEFAAYLKSSKQEFNQALKDEQAEAVKRSQRTGLDP
jgi:metallo-beta-lactamase class B